jgi:hypothetical protein
MTTMKNLRRIERGLIVAGVAGLIVAAVLMIFLLAGCTGRSTEIKGHRNEASEPVAVTGMPGCKMQTITTFTTYSDGREYRNQSLTVVRCPGDTTTTHEVIGGRPARKQEVTVFEPKAADAVTNEVTP